MDRPAHLPNVKAAEMLGIPAAFTHPQLQTDAFMELVNKLAWALGSVYRKPYSGKRTICRMYAVEMATVVQQEHGYPMKIGILEPRTDRI